MCRKLQKGKSRSISTAASEEYYKKDSFSFKMNYRNNVNVGIAAAPLQIENRPLSYFIEVIYPLSKNIYVITGRGNVASEDNLKKIHIYEIKHKIGANIITAIINHILIELEISYKLVKLSKNVDIWIFYTGGMMPLPMIATKLLNKKRLLILVGSSTTWYKSQKSILHIPAIFMSKISYLLANRIIVYSENIIKEWNLEKYRDKICITHEHFMDFDKLKIKKKLEERNNLVGYIGRLSEEKGVFNFIKAIPEILKERGNLEFLIGGDGQLRGEIEKYISKKNLNDKIKLIGWIPHDELPRYLNKLKLLVLPSFTEGLPNIVLEAMACGTPVLATPVGAIPDIIKDGQTGFIMKDNSPECIARNVIRALNHPNLEQITRNACALVEREFTFEKAVERYREILSKL